MVEKILEIDIDELGVDECNIRGSKWEYDEELIKSIEENGIIEPLLVRPADPSTGLKYGIICGSRRYNAAIEVGLTKVPCIVKKVDDATAIGLSIMENKHRKDIPGWVYAEKIRQMNKLINHGTPTTKKVKMIISKTGFAKRTVYDYLALTEAPEEIIELMKEPEERSEEVNEYIKATAPGAATFIKEKPLSKDKAVKIATNLKDFSDEKKFEVARFIAPLKEEIAMDLIEKVRLHPEKPLEEIKKMVEGIPKSATWVVQFEWEPKLVKALDNACMEKNIDRKNLVTKYVKDGLKRDRFLEED